MTIMEETIKENGLDADEVDTLQEQREEVLRKYISDWFHSESMMIEIDTVAGTCTVVKPTAKGSDTP